MYYELVVQNRHVGTIRCGDSADAETRLLCGNAVIVRCAAAEQVYVRCRKKGPDLFGYTSTDRRTTFTGLLIHAD